jgi:hypothetical protein
LRLVDSRDSYARRLDDSACLTARSRNTRTVLDDGVRAARPCQSPADIATAHRLGSLCCRKVGGTAMDLALFDFDGTITTRGTYPGFIRFAIVRRGR